MANLTVSEIISAVNDNQAGVLNIAYSVAIPVSIGANKFQPIEIGVNEDSGEEVFKVDFNLNRDTNGSDEVTIAIGRTTPELIQNTFDDTGVETYQDIFEETVFKENIQDE